MLSIGYDNQTDIHKYSTLINYNSNVTNNNTKHPNTSLNNFDIKHKLPDTTADHSFRSDGLRAWVELPVERHECVVFCNYDDIDFINYIVQSSYVNVVTQ